MTYSFFIPCIPPKATAQQKGMRLTKRRPVFFTKKHVQKSKDFFTHLFCNLRPPVPFNGPISVQLVITFPWRKGESRANRARGWVPMPVRPDYDNLSKTPVDVLGSLSFWCDDAQIYDGRVIKGWGERPGIRVTIAEVDAGADFSHLIGEGNGE